MPLANALKSVGYADTVLLLTIGKSDIYQHKSLNYGIRHHSSLDLCPKLVGCEVAKAISSEV